MNSLYIKVGSITNAQRGQRALKKYGYKATIKKIDDTSSSDGCGYALVVNTKSDDPLDILEKAKIDIKGAEHR